MAEADAILVERTLAGDLEGFGELHRRYFERLVGLVTGIVRDRVRAEDTVQEAYLSALGALSRLDDHDRFFPWIRRIAVNRAIESKRRDASRARLHDEWSAADRVERSGGVTGSDMLGLMEAEERRRRVHDALERLPDGQRAAVVLRFFEGMSMREVAGILGCEEVTARTQVFRGMQKIGRMLADG